MIIISITTVGMMIPHNNFIRSEREKYSGKNHGGN